MSCTIKILLIVLVLPVIGLAQDVKLMKRPTHVSKDQNVSFQKIKASNQAPNQDPKAKALKINRKPPSGSTVYQWNMGDANGKSESDLIGMVKAVDILVRDKAVGNERFKLMISQVTNYLALARIYRIRSPQTEKDKKNEQVCLERANKLADLLLEGKGIDNRFKARAWYFKGVAFIHMNKMNEGMKAFEESIKLDQNSEYVPLMALSMAENDFDNERFDSALKNYARFFNRFGKDQKALAIYKMAWSHYRLQDLNKAIDLMVRLLSSKDGGTLSKEALDDLAMFTVGIMNENQLIDFAGTKFFSNRQLQNDYLLAVYTLLRSQSGTNQYPTIFAELMRLETRPANKLSLMIKNLHFEQRQYASRVTIKALKDVQSFLERSSVTFQSDIFKANSEALENEIVTIITTYAETMSKKIISPENLSKTELASVLKGLIEFHFRYFPESKNKKFATTVFIGLCHEAKDYVCVYQMSKKVMSDPAMQELHVNAKRDLLIALDNIYKNSPELKTEYLSVVEIFLKEQTTDKDWMRLAKKITAIYMEEKKYDAAIPWLEKIYIREKNSENLYRYQLARYQNNKFQDIIRDPMPTGNDKFILEIQKIYRECYLKVAQSAIQNNDFITYEGNVKAFLASGADEKSSDMVRVDFLKKLLEQKNFDRLNVEYRLFSPKKWMNPGYSEISMIMLSHYIKVGMFTELLHFLQQSITFGKKADLDVFWITGVIGKPQMMSSAEQKRLNEFKADVRSYFLSILALSHPKFAQQFLKKYKGPQLSEDQKMMILSMQVEQGRTAIEIDKSTLKYLGNSVPREVLDREETSVEKKMKRIEFPSPTATEKEVEAASAKIIPKVQAIRQEVVNEIRSRSAFAQTRILRKAMTLEDQTAQLILNSPLPAELKDELKIQEYKKQLEDLAQGFTNQSGEYRKILEKVLESTGVGISNAITIVPEPEKFPKMSQDREATLARLIADGNFSGALLFVDKMRADEEISEELYYSGRARILLKINSGEFMVNYVIQELKGAGINSLLALFTAPAPEVK